LEWWREAIGGLGRRVVGHVGEGLVLLERLIGRLVPVPRLDGRVVERDALDRKLAARLEGRRDARDGLGLARIAAWFVAVWDYMARRIDARLLVRFPLMRDWRQDRDRLQLSWGSARWGRWWIHLLAISA
jgi:hypothetical protein